ncbi:MAG: magnesium transporter [Congregibacter sp.]
MNKVELDAIDELNQRFFLESPRDAAQLIEALDPNEVAGTFSHQPLGSLIPVWRLLLPETAARLIRVLPDTLAHDLIVATPPSHATRLLGFLSDEESATYLSKLEPDLRAELKTLLSYPPNTAGRLMNTGISSFRRDTMAGAALENLRASGMTTARSLFLVDDDHRLTGKVSLTDLALAQQNRLLGELESPIVSSVRPIDSLAEITRILQTGSVLDLPVLDLDGVLLGAITHDDVARTVQKSATADLQTMVGASADERALSSPWFAVRKRMPWLQVNLLTAFLAAAVVGIFEDTIAKVTALAVLLPVVAGQSGNTGAQALAVTMRGLALREITVRQWSKVLRKELIAGFVNGIGVAMTCGVGVFMWSKSLGLVAVIMSSMVLAMIAAGFAGAVIPVILTRLGQDPATSSSIILTTVTDVAGFFAFLGIASALMEFL